MPISTNYGSTGRPPGEFHLRHSSKEISDILEFPFTPFDIFFNEFANNNNKKYCYNDGETDTLSTTSTTPTIDYHTSTYDDNNEANTIAHRIHRTDRLCKKWLASNGNNNNNNNNNNTNELTNAVSITTTTTTTDYNTSTNDKNDKEKALNNNRRTLAAKDINNRNISSNNNNELPEVIDSISNNNSNNNTTTLSTINYNTSTYDDNKEADTAQSIHRTDETVIKWFDLLLNNNNIEITTTTNNNNRNNDATSTTATTTTTTTNPSTINYNTSAYDDNNRANTAPRIHRTDKTKWFDLIFNKNNNIHRTDTLSTESSTTTSTTTNDETFHLPLFEDDSDADTDADDNRRITLAANDNKDNNNNSSNNSTEFDTSFINYSTSTYDDNNKANIIAHSIHRTDNTLEQLTKWSLAANDNIRRIKSSSPKEFKTAKEKQQQQQQQHHHGKQRYQFRLEQQQKHQHFKQVYNTKRMVTSIVLKLTLVAWDVWAFRNVY